MIYEDNIGVGVSTKEELKHEIEQILKNLTQVGMTINKEKCEINCNKVSYLEYQIAKAGISLNERLTKKIAEMSTPRNKKSNWNPFWD